MKISIKNHIFSLIEWIDENRELKIRIATDETLVSLATIFDGENEISIIGDNEEVNGYWYSSKLINITNQNNGIFEIKLAGSLINSNAEGKLSDSIEDTESAIFELADMIATLESAHSDSEMYINQYKERVEENIRQIDEKDNITNEKFNEQTSLVINMQTQISELRQTLNTLQATLGAIPKNIEDRTIVLENAYNRLADRVAELENRS